LFEPALWDQDFYEIRFALLDRSVPFEGKNDIVRALIRRSHADSDADAAVLCVAACLLPGRKQIAGTDVDIPRFHESWADLTAAPSEESGRRSFRTAANLRALTRRGIVGDLVVELRRDRSANDRLSTQEPKAALTSA
jgi:hypothetical protein